MHYHLEALGEDRFQALCQALILLSHPDVQCMPLNQPDGGRDALLRRKGKPFVVFQVKFVRHPNTKEARDTVEQAVKTEQKKIQRLIKRGAQAYFLLTNVPGTGHLDTGSIDKLDDYLTTELGIESKCWWRDDLERRIDGNADLKWSYPDILKGADVLQLLLQGGEDVASKRRTSTLRRYMIKQERDDSNLKFRQIELQKGLIDLFVDVPATLDTNEANKTAVANLQVVLETRAGQKKLGESPSANAAFEKSGCLSHLTAEDFGHTFTRIVVEGAPGQGKSTITQYLCQLHRYMLLQRTAELNRVPIRHVPDVSRIPFRVDLRDYALWLTGRDPFSENQSDSLPSATSMVLESLIAYQVTKSTGSSFSVDDFVSCAEKARILVVLDGFDEVADVNLRNRIVKEVSDTEARLRDGSLSSMVVVTSRPAAFANSPGFPRDSWQHLQLQSLSRPGMELYATKWLTAKMLQPKDQKEILALLKEKLTQDHIKELARNPMQLAILLSLISVKGASLPDKRTALYDGYVDIFLNRESEKSRIVRENRDVLVDIHRYLAWLLHTEAEKGTGNGAISEPRLRETVKAYLERSGHDPSLVDLLFHGMMERIVVLVARVQGTFEFEVQPLREYFAGRYLYDTAPYSPSGDAKRGTLPERFDAIARNFYWLNVARFFAGCYSTGELDSLVSCLSDLSRQENYRYSDHIRKLTAVLINDHVFSQAPKLIARLTDAVFPVERAHLVFVEDSERSSVTFPRCEARGRYIVEAQKVMLKRTSYQRDAVGVAASFLIYNSRAGELENFWSVNEHQFDAPSSWVSAGADLGVLQSAPSDVWDRAIVSARTEAADKALRADRHDVLSKHDDLMDLALEQVLDSPSAHLSVSRDLAELGSVGELIVYLTEMTRLIWSGHRASSTNLSIREVAERSSAYPLHRNVAKTQKHDAVWKSEYSEIALQLKKMLDLKVSEVGRDCRHFADVISIGQQTFGEREVFKVFAFLAAHLAIDVSAEAHRNCSNDLVTKAFEMRRNHDSTEWWLSTLSTARQSEATVAILGLLHWASPTVVWNVRETASALLDRCSAVEFDTIYEMLMFGNASLDRAQINAPTAEGLSPRLASLLIDFVDERGAETLWNNLLRDHVASDFYVKSTIIEYYIRQARTGRIPWAQAMVPILDGYRDGLQVYIPQVLDEERHFIPLDLATEICREAEKMPVELVKLAQMSISAELGAMVQSVGGVAERDGWVFDAAG